MKNIETEIAQIEEEIREIDKAVALSGTILESGHFICKYETAAGFHNGFLSEREALIAEYNTLKGRR